MNVPKLRFPGFYAGWEEKVLGDQATFFSGGTPTSTVKEFYNGDIPFIKSGEINSIETEQFLSPHGFKSSSAKMVEKGDLLFALYGATSGEVGISKMNGAINQAVLCIRSATIEIPLLQYYFQRNKEVILTKYLQGGQGNLSAEIIKNLFVCFPSLPEQQKIASFLSSVDNVIQLLTKKKTLLEKYKKGVMQKIFSQLIRFKDDNGNDFPDWEEKRFGNLFRFISTNSLSREKLNYETGELKNIHYGDIHTKFDTLFDSSKVNVPYVNSDQKINNLSDDNYCIEGDIIFADASEDLLDVGKCIEVIDTMNEKIIAGLHTIHARPTINSFAPGFAGYLMKSPCIRKRIMFIAQGSKVSSISPKQLATVTVSFPCLPEQKKIADFLSGIDRSIEIVNSQVEKTKMYKKGLLQQMFV